jgi:hypothetical protein
MQQQIGFCNHVCAPIVFPDLPACRTRVVAHSGLVREARSFRPDFRQETPSMTAAHHTRQSLLAQLDAWEIADQNGRPRTVVHGRAIHQGASRGGGRAHQEPLPERQEGRAVPGHRGPRHAGEPEKPAQEARLRQAFFWQCRAHGSSPWRHARVRHRARHHQRCRSHGHASCSTRR